MPTELIIPPDSFGPSSRKPGAQNDRDRPDSNCKRCSLVPGPETRSPGAHHDGDRPGNNCGRCCVQDPWSCQIVPRAHYDGGRPADCCCCWGTHKAGCKGLLREQAQRDVSGAAGHGEQPLEGRVHRLRGRLCVYLGPALLAHQERLVQIPRLRMHDLPSAAPLASVFPQEWLFVDAVLLSRANSQLRMVRRHDLPCVGPWCLHWWS